MNDKKNLIIVAVIMAIVATSMFLIVDISTVFIIAYVFALIGVAGLIITAMQIVEKKDVYPWGAAIPLQALRYLIIEVIVSVIVVTLRKLNLFELSAGYFAVIHIVILAFYAIRIVLMLGGKMYIEKMEEKNHTKVSVIKEMQAEVENLLSTVEGEGVKMSLKKLEEAIRYSDPVTGEELVKTDVELLAEVQRLHEALTDETELMRRTELFLKNLKQRNTKAKLLK